MVHVLKKATKNHKGLLVFTHKEWGYFSGNKLTKRLKRENRLPKGLVNELRQPFSDTLKNLSKQYLIGVHFGFYYPHQFNSQIASFVMSRESNLPNIAAHIKRLEFNSRDFVPVIFSRQDTPKKWDIMTVARDVKFKKFPQLFAATKKMLRQRPETKFLFVVPSQRGVKWGVERGLVKEFYGLFSREEQKNITFLYLHPDLEWGLSQADLAWLYNQSRVFTLFSSKEGESRVISEALCCGLPVVVYDKLLGGSKDLLDEETSVFFPEYDQAHEAWLTALKRFPAGLKTQPEMITREDYSIDRMASAISDLYAQLDLPFDGQLDGTADLDRHLPAHHYDVPWRLDTSAPTADILSKKQFQVFLDTL